MRKEISNDISRHFKTTIVSNFFASAKSILLGNAHQITIISSNSLKNKQRESHE